MLLIMKLCHYRIADGNPILYLKKENEEDDILPLPGKPNWPVLLTPPTNLATIQLPEIKWIDVLVVSMISPCHFYVQYLSEDTSIQPIQELCDTMETYFGQNQICKSHLKLFIFKPHPSSTL